MYICTWTCTCKCPCVTCYSEYKLTGVYICSIAGALASQHRWGGEVPVRQVQRVWPGLVSVVVGTNGGCPVLRLWQGRWEEYRTKSYRWVQVRVHTCNMIGKQNESQRTKSNASTQKWELAPSSIPPSSPRVTWISFMSILSLCIEKPYHVFHWLCSKCASVAARYELKEVFDNLIITLCKFTTLLNTHEVGAAFVSPRIYSLTDEKCMVLCIPHSDNVCTVEPPIKDSLY